MTDAERPQHDDDKAVDKQYKASFELHTCKTAGPLMLESTT